MSQILPGPTRLPPQQPQLPNQIKASSLGSHGSKSSSRQPLALWQPNHGCINAAPDGGTDGEGDKGAASEHGTCSPGGQQEKLRQPELHLSGLYARPGTCHLTPEAGVPGELRVRGVRAVAKERPEPRAGGWAWNEKGKGRVPGLHPPSQGLWYTGDVHGEEPPGMKGCVESLLPLRLWRLSEILFCPLSSLLCSSCVAAKPQPWRPLLSYSLPCFLSFDQSGQVC